MAKGSNQGQSGMVLLSVIGLVLVLSVLAASASRQMHWLLQTAAQSITMLAISRDTVFLSASYMA